MKNSITYFFIVLFLSLKMLGLHALTHNEDTDQDLHCAVCDYATTINTTPILTPEVQDFPIENLEFSPPRHLITTYGFVSSNTLAIPLLFSRPPPYFI